MIKLPDNSPIIIAHRGCRDRFPENTLEAFQAAVNSGADMIELDIALTKDRRLAVIHDDTVDRTTNGEGQINQHTLTELKRLDAGSWFSGEFKNCRIPDLEEVFNTVGNKISINIEIKSSAFEASPESAPVEQLTLDLIRKYNLSDSVIVSSFEPGILTRLSALAPDYALAFITEEPLNPSILNILRSIKAYSWHPWYKTLTRDQIDQVKSDGFRIFPFTVNSPDDYRNLIEWGIDGVFTDHVRITDLKGNPLLFNES